MSVEWIDLLWGWGGGLLLGLFYFGGLWVTTRKAAGTERPFLLIAASFMVRIAILLGGLYVLTDGHPLLLGAALIGIWLARQVVMGLVRRGLQTRDGSHAGEGSPEQ